MASLTTNNTFGGLQGNNPSLQNLFKPAKSLDSSIQRGELIVFHYNFFKHDPRPHIIVTDVNPGNRIRGVNLHYITFHDIKQLLQMSCGVNSFSYKNIVGQNVFTNAFRSYKWAGIKGIKKMDCDFVRSIMNLVRNFDPAEIEIVRRLVREQLQRQVNQKTSELAAQQQVVPQTNNIPLPTQQNMPQMNSMGDANGITAR